MKDIIPVVYATDDNYLFFTCVSICSLADNADEGTFYIIYILVDETFQDKEQILEELKAEYFNIEISLIKVNGDIFSNVHIHNEHISRAAFYRLNICSYIQKDKCIYLDSDTLVTEDLSDLYNYDLHGFYMAGCRDIWIDTLTTEELEDRRIKTRIPDFDEYINSGVLLLNLKEMRKDEIDRKLLEYSQYDFPYEDQDILNVCCYGHILQLPTKWNNFTAAVGRDVELRNSGVPEEIIIDFQKEEGIYHYITSEARPWNEYRYWRNWCWWRVADKWANKKIYSQIKMVVDDHDAQMQWRNCLDKLNSRESIVIWGYTDLAKDIADWIVNAGKKCSIHFCDSNEMKQGECYKGWEVISPDYIFKEYKDSFFIITSNRGKDEIIKNLKEHNISEEQLYVFSKRKNVGFYRMLDKRYYEQELEEIFLKEGIQIPKEQMITETKNHPEWNEKYNLNRWILRK